MGGWVGITTLLKISDFVLDLEGTFKKTNLAISPINRRHARGFPSFVKQKVLSLLDGVAEAGDRHPALALPCALPF